MVSRRSTLATFLRPPMILSFAFNFYLIMMQQREWSATQSRRLDGFQLAIQPVSLPRRNDSTTRYHVRRAGTNVTHAAATESTSKIPQSALSSLGNVTMTTNNEIAAPSERQPEKSLAVTEQPRKLANMTIDEAYRSNHSAANATTTTHFTTTSLQAIWKRQPAYIASQTIQTQLRNRFLTNRKARTTVHADDKFFHVQLLPPSPSVERFTCRAFDVHYCRGDGIRRRDFSPELRATIGDFTPVLTTNRNVLIMGDSVGIQLSHLLQQQAGVVLGERRVLKTYNDTGGIKEWISAATTQGGGVIAGYRILGFLTKEGPNLYVPPWAPKGTGGGGWLHEDVARLKQYMLQSGQSTYTFDTLIFRIPQVWIPLHQIHFDNLRQTVELAQELFHVTTVIFTDLPVINNYNETAHLLELSLANQRLQAFVNHWQRNVAALDAHKPKVFLLEIGTLINNLGIRNAQDIGYDVSNPQYILNRIREERPFPRSIALNCADQINSNGTCPSNMLFKDGVHWCMETVGPRILAGLSCLHHCSDHDCDSFCNHRYMRLRSIA